MRTFICFLFVCNCSSVYGQIIIDSIKTTLNGSWPLYRTDTAKEPSYYSLAKGDSVTIIGYGIDRFNILTKHKNLRTGQSLTGYVIIYAVDGLDDLKKKVEDYSLNKRSENARALKMNEDKRYNDLTLKFGATNAKRILNKEYWIGMTKEMATISLGKPKDINRTVTAKTVTEQWVYSAKLYLYFENGTLVSFQD
jgi:hypothetical protein